KQAERARALFVQSYESSFQPKRDFYQSSSVPFYLARSLPPTEKKKEIQILQDAMQKAPGDPWILADLVVLTRNQQFKNRLETYFDEIDAQLFLGKAYLHFG